MISTSFPCAARVRPRSFADRPRRCAAFTIVQVLVSMSVCSIVLTFAVPKVKQSERQSRATIIVADLRTFASTFERYAQERGAWPAETNAGVMPPEMAEHLGASGWLRETPIGGQYNWDANQMHSGTRYRAVISISETSLAALPLNEELLTDIDRMMDDGNLATGQFRTGVSYDPIYILQQ